MSTMTFDSRQALVPARPRTSAPRSTASRRTTLRLTRRGRLAVLLLGLAGLLVFGVMMTAGAGAALHSGAPETTHTIVVSPGDTLWDISAKAAAGGDIRGMEQHIKELNGLDSGMLLVGQRLRVPSN